MTAPESLQSAAARHWKVGMPFKQALEQGSGTRLAATRLVYHSANPERMTHYCMPAPPATAFCTNTRHALGRAPLVPFLQGTTRTLWASPGN
ncbi:MAG: hypothetical protein H7274_02160 [Rhodoferax sp.]|nr:hypothetical protein [Rhodoferax sp.]